VANIQWKVRTVPSVQEGVVGLKANFFFYNVYSHKKKTKKIQCSYESPRKEAREEYG
jgi:hypothetical protein